MTSARARLEGREPPERRAPCFFDPRHGPSTRDVEWAPIGGEPRMVPACEADAQRVERGDDPEAREVTVGGQRMPYWAAGPMYAPFMGGFYGAGLLPGLLIGTSLGGVWDAPSAVTSAVVTGVAATSAAATSAAATSSRGVAPANPGWVGRLGSRPLGLPIGRLIGPQAY